MLTALQSYSQTDTKDIRPVTVPFWVAQEIAVDLEEKDRLQLVEVELKNSIDNLKQIAAKNFLLDDARLNQLAMKDRFIKILETQLAAEKAKKPDSNWFVWTLGVIAALGTGFIVGSF